MLTSIPRYVKEIFTRMAQQTLKLSDEDMTHILTILRNSTAPITTQQLVDALKQRSNRP